MRVSFSISVGLVSLLALATVAPAARSADSRKEAPPPTATPQQGRKAVEKGLDFIQKDAVKWRTERKCSTCHHGTMTLWVLNEAKSQGYPVAAEVLADTAKWAREKLDRIDLPRDTR